MMSPENLDYLTLKPLGSRQRNVNRPQGFAPLKIDLSNLKDLTNLNLFIRGGGLDHS